jgi:NAD(P)H-nitrite reductase large subunit
MDYVIIGNSAAAIGAVKGIREVDTEGSITLISDETYHTYSRPLISYWLSGKVTDKNMYYRDLDFYEKNNCKTIFGKKAIGIDTAKKSVKMEDNSTISYDKLLIATGSSPFVPPIAGIEKAKNAFTFLDWDSAVGIKNVITESSKVVIMGAGLIGLKAAEALIKVCSDVTVVDLADRVLPSILDAEGASFVQKAIEEHDIKFVLNDAAASASENSITLKSGKQLDFDVLIIAVGVKPNTSLIKDAGGTVNRGIYTDEFQKTSLDDIYAAGDCTESYDITSGQYKILALLPNAYLQGEVAGKNMAGATEKYEKAIPMNAIGFFGYHMITAGGMEGEIFTVITGNNYKKLIFGDNKLKGFILIGDIDRAGIYTSLIRDEVSLNEVDIDILKNKPQLLMFSKQDRKAKLSGGK